MDRVFEKTTERMEKALDALERDFSTIRAGRANPNVLNNVVVEYYGTPTPLNQMAAVSVPEPRMLVIQPWDASTLKMTARLSASHSHSSPRSTEKLLLRMFQSAEKRQRLQSEMYAVIQWMI